MKTIEFIEAIDNICSLYHEHRIGSTDSKYRKLLSAKQKFWRRILSSPVEPEISQENGVDKIMDVIREAEEYYRNLLETDYKNRDYSACWVCQIKLQLLDELEFDIEKLPIIKAREL